MSGRFQTTLSPTARIATSRAPAERAHVLRSGAFGRERPLERRQVLSQELFRDAVARERLRADRYEEAFVLVLVSLHSRQAPQSRGRHVVEVLSQANIDADVIGWLEQGSVLGFIRSLAAHEPEETATTLAATVGRELMRQTPGHVDGASVRLEVYSPQIDTTPPVRGNAGNKRGQLKEEARDVAKRLLDIVGSTASLIIFSPVFLVVSAAVKLTSTGPVLFRQQRIGEAGRPFIMLKFRTMHANADPSIHQQYVANFIQSRDTFGSGKNVAYKIVDDPRVTPLGHFLRKSSLDELPQLWNVLKGNMSLVGPRPPLPSEVALYKRWHRRRVHEVKPGITGLWQVAGRSRTTFDEMVRLDLRYAKNCSVWTDLRILLATPRAVISGKGAY